MKRGIIALPIMSLVFSCILFSGRKYFWYDELLSYYLISDDSFIHMLRALADHVDSSPPLYYMLGWAWAKIFGTSELSLRMISCLGICLSCWIIYSLLKQVYTFWPALIGVLSVFCCSNLMPAYRIP
ncbi:glycosyltransferase family 39 protein [Acidobacteriota bacterium]